MPRYPSQFSLPPLETALPHFEALDPERPKVEQVAETLRQLILEYRTRQNQTFYSTRELARFFAVSQNTAALAVERLESEGLLRRIRGSQTVMLGSRIITRTRIRAVAGLMSWIFAQRFSEAQIDLSRSLGQALWTQQIALDIIPHYDIGDTRPDLNETLKKHRLDFVIWPFPFNHHKEHLLFLRDRGVRNLVIGVEGVRSPFTPDVLVDFRSSYEELLRYWKETHGIRRVVVVNPGEFTPRRRINLFATVAREAGIDCCVEPSSYTLPGEILAREKKKVGIALLDEHATAEFVFYDPPSFVALCKRHRILLGNGSLNVPFVAHGELRLERIFVPMMPNNPNFTRPLVPAIVKMLTQWSFGDFSAPPQSVQTRFWPDGVLWRYL